MIGSLLFRNFLLQLVTPAIAMVGDTHISHLLRSIVPELRGGLSGYGIGQVAGLLGMMAFAPPALIMTDQAPPAQFTFRRAANIFGVAIALSSVTWIVFNRPDASLLFLIMAALVAITFYTGFLGAAVSVLAIGVLALCVQMNSLGQGRTTVLDTEALVVQIFLATTTGVTLLVAGALDQRNRFQAQLEKAKQFAEDAGEAKARFLAVMSHEIRSPLASMTMLASTLRRATAQDDVRSDTVTVMERVSRRVLDLLDGVLSYTRFQAVGYAIERSPTDVARLIDDIVATLAIQAAEKGVVLGVATTPGPQDLIDLDHARVGQVLANLISNAIRHGLSTVTISADLATAGRVRFAVNDDGAGMSPETQQQIFNPYYRAAGDVQSGHVGLGLAICRELVEAMGGTIGVSNAAGGSTTFWFELPLDGATTASAEPQVGI